MRTAETQAAGGVALIARVVKAVAGQFFLHADGETFAAAGRGKCKLGGKILVGDLAECENGVIERVLPRKSVLVRPAVANADGIVVVVAPIPEPDLMLVDKLIIYADLLGLPVTLALNKLDLQNPAFTAEMRAQYGGVTERIFCVSTATGEGLDALRAALGGRLTVFAGQSAVGKSSLLNALAGGERMRTGEVGERSGRGRHTTRHAEIFDLGGAEIVDTPGFSMLDGAELTLVSDDADYYYTDLFALAADCRYNRCTHTHEPDCAVKAALAAGTLSRARYERYLRLREELAAAKRY